MGQAIPENRPSRSGHEHPRRIQCPFTLFRREIQRCSIPGIHRINHLGQNYIIFKMKSPSLQHLGRIATQIKSKRALLKMTTSMDRGVVKRVKNLSNSCRKNWAKMSCNRNCLCNTTTKSFPPCLVQQFFFSLEGLRIDLGEKKLLDIVKFTFRIL